MAQSRVVSEIVDQCQKMSSPRNRDQRSHMVIESAWYHSVDCIWFPFSVL